MRARRRVRMSRALAHPSSAPPAKGDASQRSRSVTERSIALTARMSRIPRAEDTVAHRVVGSLGRSAPGESAVLMTLRFATESLKMAGPALVRSCSMLHLSRLRLPLRRNTTHQLSMTFLESTALSCPSLVHSAASAHSSYRGYRRDGDSFCRSPKELTRDCSIFAVCPDASDEDATFCATILDRPCSFLGAIRCKNRRCRGGNLCDGIVE